MQINADKFSAKLNAVNVNVNQTARELEYKYIDSSSQYCLCDGVYSTLSQKSVVQWGFKSQLLHKSIYCVAVQA